MGGGQRPRCASRRWGGGGARERLRIRSEVGASADNPHRGNTCLASHLPLKLRRKQVGMGLSGAGVAGLGKYRCTQRAGFANKAQNEILR
jgi:hypothetical protein